MNQNQLTMTRGDDRIFDFSGIEDPGGTAYDLNNVTAIAFRVDGLFLKTLADFDIDPSAGEMLVDVVPADTEDCPNHRAVYRYDLELTITDIGTRTVRRGLFVVMPDVTNPA